MPLAHLLAPQLMKKAQEIEAALGHAPPVSAGYLAQTQNAGYEKTPYDPKGLINKSGPQSYDPRGSTRGSLMSMLGKMQNSGDPSLQTMARGIVAGIDNTDNGAMPRGRSVPQMIPNVPVQRQPGDPIPYANEGLAKEVVGLTERGEPIYASEPGFSIADRYAGAPAAHAAVRDGKRGKRVIIPLDSKDAVGINERGESVNRRGKKLGYLAEPAFVTPGGALPMRTLERGKLDHLTNHDGSLRQDDKFGVSAMQQLYGDDLKVQQENLDARGRPTDKLPEDYLRHLPEKQRKDIINGVKALAYLDKGQSI